MQIVDLNQVMISNFMAQIGNHTNIKIEEDLLRHMVLNSLRSYNQKFRHKYGEMVIACDDKMSWRRGVFPYYKAARRKDRAKSEIDWNTLFVVLDKLKGELNENFPYRVIQVANAEADDIIATLCHMHGDTDEPILIISGDKDFRQLQKYANVDQYDPVRKKQIREDNPELYLKEHIMTGDKGDGVPNFLSKDDVFVVGGRQKPLRRAKLDEWLKQPPAMFCDAEMIRGWMRNEQLVDLSKIPGDVVESIANAFDAQGGKDRSKLYTYFVQNRLRNLMSDIDQF